MEIKMINVDGILITALVVDEDTPYLPCENCGGRKYAHKLLAKTDDDWCMNCDDEHYRGDMTDEEQGRWTLEKMMDGLAVMVAMEQ